MSYEVSQAAPEAKDSPPVGIDVKFTAPEVQVRSPWQRWRDFWFCPADPTTLAFIRISTGLLVLYIHLAYSLDLQAFFGEHGWYAARFINRERKESPMMVTPWLDHWEDTQEGWAQLSDFPHRRAALMRFLRSLPIDAAQRQRDLAFLQRVFAFRNSADVLIALNYIQSIGTERELERYLTALQGGQVDVSEEIVIGSRPKSLGRQYEPPPVFATLSLEEKRQLAQEIRSFWQALARVPWIDPKQERTYVINHFMEAGPPVRQALLEFMLTLPADEQQRNALLDYLEYWNVDPRKTYRQGHAIFSMWFHVTDPTAMAWIHAGVLGLIVLFTVGLFTRVTSVLVWLATVSYIHRTQQILFGMDTMMNILLFYLMIGNCGAALSLDRLIARYRATRAALRRGGLDTATRAFLAYPPPSVAAGFAQRLIQVHFCFIYMAAGLSKLKGGMWWHGQAFWEVLVNPEFTLLHYSWYENAVRWLVSFKPMYHIMLASAVWFTLFVEIAGPFLLWTRLRWLVIFLATLMHAIIAVLMGLNLFELLMIVMLLAFLPDRVIRDRFRGGPDLPRFRWCFHPQRDAECRAAAWIAAVDVDNQVRLQPVSADQKTPYLLPGEGETLRDRQAVYVLLSSLRLAPVLRPLCWIPPMRGWITRLLFPT
jgi:hypothetical protein